MTPRRRPVTVRGRCPHEPRRRTDPGARARRRRRRPSSLPRLARHPITLADGHLVGVVGRRPGRPARRGPRLLGRGVPLRPDPVAARVDGLQGRSPSTPPATAAPRACPPAAQDLERLHRAARAGWSTSSASSSAVLAGHSMGGRLVTAAGRRPARAGHRGAPARRHRRRHLGPHGLPVPRRPAAARRRRRGARWSTPLSVAAAVPRPAPGRQARPPGRARRSSATSCDRGAWSARASRSCGRASSWMLDELADREVPVFAIHGDRDLAVPLAPPASAPSAPTARWSWSRRPATRGC